MTPRQEPVSQCFFSLQVGEITLQQRPSILRDYCVSLAWEEIKVQVGVPPQCLSLSYHRKVEKIFWIVVSWECPCVFHNWEITP